MLTVIDVKKKTKKKPKKTKQIKTTQNTKQTKPSRILMLLRKSVNFPFY